MTPDLPPSSPSPPPEPFGLIRTVLNTIGNAFGRLARAVWPPNFIARGTSQTNNTPLSERSISVSGSDTSSSSDATDGPNKTLTELAALRNTAQVAAFKADARSGGHSMTKWLKEDPQALGDILKHMSSRQAKSIMRTYGRNIQSYGSSAVAPLLDMIKVAFPHGSSTLHQVMQESPEYQKDTLTTSTILMSFLGEQPHSESIYCAIKEMEAYGDLSFWGVRQFLLQNVATEYSMDISSDEELAAKAKSECEGRLPEWHVAQRLKEAPINELGMIKSFIELAEFCGDNPRIRPVLKELDRLMFKSMDSYNKARFEKGLGEVDGEKVGTLVSTLTTDQVRELHSANKEQKAVLLEQLGWQPLPPEITKPTGEAEAKDLLYKHFMDEIA